MTEAPLALRGQRVHDGTRFCPDTCAMLTRDRITFVPQAEAAQATPLDLPAGDILPGAIDLQVNGGAGIMLGDDPSAGGIARIAQAHRQNGTCYMLPTLITDTPEKTAVVIDAVVEAIARQVPGILGLHLEGPHLDPHKKGAHDANLIRPMTAQDVRLLKTAAGRLHNLMVTLAPEAASLDQIAELTDAGLVVSLGHSNCSYETACAAFDAGACAVTHLFNAMSGLQSRSPGLVGAALSRGNVAAGLIADGHHVHAGALGAALAARPDGIFLVSDAMAPAGSAQQSFTLNGRQITRADGRLTLADGTLAGADLTLGRAITLLREDIGVSTERALAMVTGVPRRLLRAPGQAGVLDKNPGALAHYSSETGQLTPLADVIAASRN